MNDRQTFVAQGLCLVLAGFALFGSVAARTASPDLERVLSQRIYHELLVGIALANSGEPIAATKNGWSGTATVTVFVNAQARVAEIRLAHSSGDRAADEEALRMVRIAAARLKPTQELADSETSVALVFGTPRGAQLATGGTFTVTKQKHGGKATVTYRATGDAAEGKAGQGIKSFEVEGSADASRDLAIVRKVITIIRSRYKGDFNWQSQRLNTEVVLSARPEDNEALEHFLLLDFDTAIVPQVSRTDRLLAAGAMFRILRVSQREALVELKLPSPQDPPISSLVYQVDAGNGGNVELAVVHLMMKKFREHYEGDFDFESERLHKAVKLSARVEDNAYLESFLQWEFFGPAAPVQPSESQEAGATE